LAAAPATPEAFIARRGATAQWQNLRQPRREPDKTAQAILPYAVLGAELEALVGVCLGEG
ncbi:MAG: hypothetical protein ACKN9T_07165, partial [Candidatus Methylumidiphilus sp.]